MPADRDAPLDTSPRTRSGTGTTTVGTIGNAMKVTLKLFATLAPYLPAGAKQNQVELDVPAATTVAALLEPFRLPADQVHLVMVNGIHMEPDRRAAEPLKENDTVAVFPPVAGG